VNGYRTGMGYDAHRFAVGRPLVLGGVTVPHPKGLLGHSDADVLVHALMDALLGAAGLGDIGRHFPDGDPAYKGADSVALLSRAADLLTRSGWEVVNADATLLAERPRVAAHVPAMVKRLEGVLGEGTVSIKASTCEGMGFVGREEGMAALAVCLLKRRELD
jgi:2-C-methyl-D-erythritol 2,4-cyclodiphosphate synthase